MLSNSTRGDDYSSSSEPRVVGSNPSRRATFLSQNALIRAGQSSGLFKIANKKLMDFFNCLFFTPRGYHFIKAHRYQGQDTLRRNRSHDEKGDGNPLLKDRRTLKAEKTKQVTKSPSLYNGRSPAGMGPICPPAGQRQARGRSP